MPFCIALDLLLLIERIIWGISMAILLEEFRPCLRNWEMRILSKKEADPNVRLDTMLTERTHLGMWLCHHALLSDLLYHSFSTNTAMLILVLAFPIPCMQTRRMTLWNSDVWLSCKGRHWWYAV